MWGLHRSNDVPPTPNVHVLKEFYARFSTAEQVEWVVNDPASRELIAQDSIMSLKELRTGDGTFLVASGIKPVNKQREDQVQWWWTS